jgi:hypothetical protein
MDAHSPGLLGRSGERARSGTVFSDMSYREGTTVRASGLTGHGLTKQYGGVHALDGVDSTIAAGEVALAAAAACGPMLRTFSAKGHAAE